MVFANRESTALFKILYNDPIYFNNLLYINRNGYNELGYTLYQLVSFLNDYDNEGEIYCGGNIFHLLSRCVGKPGESDTEGSLFYDIILDQYVAIEIFDNLIKLGVNPYHFILDYQNILDTAIISKRSENKEYINYVNNYLLHNPPVFNNVSMSDKVLYDSYDMVKNILKNNDTALYDILGDELYWKFKNLEEDNMNCLLFDVGKHYVINSNYNNIDSICPLITSLL